MVRARMLLVAFLVFLSLDPQLSAHGATASLKDPKTFTTAVDSAYASSYVPDTLSNKVDDSGSLDSSFPYHKTEGDFMGVQELGGTNHADITNAVVVRYSMIAIGMVILALGLYYLRLLLSYEDGKTCNLGNVPKEFFWHPLQYDDIERQSEVWPEVDLATRIVVDLDYENGKHTVRPYLASESFQFDSDKTIYAYMVHRFNFHVLAADEGGGQVKRIASQETDEAGQETDGVQSQGEGDKHTRAVPGHRKKELKSKMALHKNELMTLRKKDLMALHKKELKSMGDSLDPPDGQQYALLQVDIKDSGELEEEDEDIDFKALSDSPRDTEKDIMDNVPNHQDSNDGLIVDGGLHDGSLVVAVDCKRFKPSSHAKRARVDADQLYSSPQALGDYLAYIKDGIYTDVNLKTHVIHSNVNVHLDVLSVPKGWLWCPQKHPKFEHQYALVLEKADDANGRCVIRNARDHNEIMLKSLLDFSNSRAKILERMSELNAKAERETTAHSQMTLSKYAKAFAKDKSWFSHLQAQTDNAMRVKNRLQIGTNPLKISEQNKYHSRLQIYLVGICFMSFAVIPSFLVMNRPEGTDNMTHARFTLSTPITSLLTPIIVAVVFAFVGRFFKLRGTAADESEHVVVADEYHLFSNFYICANIGLLLMVTFKQYYDAQKMGVIEFQKLRTSAFITSWISHFLFALFFAQQISKLLRNMAGGYLTQLPLIVSEERETLLLAMAEAIGATNDFYGLVHETYGSPDNQCDLRDLYRLVNNSASRVRVDSYASFSYGCEKPVPCNTSDTRGIACPWDEIAMLSDPLYIEDYSCVVTCHNAAEEKDYHTRVACRNVGIQGAVFDWVDNIHPENVCDVPPSARVAAK